MSMRDYASHPNSHLRKIAMTLIIFDKDGVLLDLPKTWLPVARDITYLLSELTEHRYSAQLFQEIIGIEEQSETIDPDGLFASGSFLDQQAACIAKAPELQAHFDDPSYREKVMAIVQRNNQRGAVPLGDVQTALGALRDQGYRCAILTNDSEASAKRSSTELGIISHFEEILGFDSGYGGKPAPEGFLEICRRCDYAPEETIMVGDTSADLGVATAAGAGLFIGISARYPAPTKALETASHLLPNIEGLPDYLAQTVARSA